MDDGRVLRAGRNRAPEPAAPADPEPVSIKRRWRLTSAFAPNPNRNHEKACMYKRI
jgi:hypothetical protein